jgi:hypothetical protein
MSDVAGIGHNNPPEPIVSVVPIEPILCTIPQAATIIGRGQSFIYEAIARKQIRAVKSDKRTLVFVDSLRAYAEALPAAKIKPPIRKRRRAA